MDKSALAAQIAGCVSHTGDLFAFGGKTFPANLATEPAPASGYDQDAGVIVIQRLTTARSYFTGAWPKEGNSFTDAMGNSYRILRDLSKPTAAEAIFIIGPAVKPA